jgi:HK97 family phage prohead protease
MSGEVLHRTAAVADLEVRSGGDGRTVHGMVVPYDTPAEIPHGSSSYLEEFRMGSFARSVAERGDRIKLLSQHNRESNPLGRATSLVEDPRGLTGSFRISKTTQGDDALELIRDGSLDSFSIGFKPVTDEWAPNQRSVVRAEAVLLEVSVVSFPAYAGAAISGVRCAELDDLEQRLAALVSEPIGSIPSLSRGLAMRRLALISLGARNV